MMHKSPVCKSKEELVQWLKSCQPIDISHALIARLPGNFDYPCVMVIATDEGWLGGYTFVHYNEFQKARYVTE